MQETHHIAQLLKKSLEGTLSPAEDAELRAWLGSDAIYQALLDRMHNGHSLEELLLLRYSLEQHDGQDYADLLQEKLGARIADSQGTPKFGQVRRWLSYAAAVLIGVTAATWIFFGEQLNQEPELVNLQSVDIQPGGNRATLTLADGRTIDLSEVQTGIIVGDEITYHDGSNVLEQGTRTKEQANHSGTEKGNLRTNYYVLNTPKGGTYQVILADGTKVWLNSASTLKYPSHFDADERVVELTGEAYFDVTNAAEQKNKTTQRDAWPFRVVSAGQTVEVLGTQFNITAYTDEAETKTTLVEGSVRISSIDDDWPPATIKPGEQAINHGGNMTIKQVDISQFTAWKDGLFYFDGLAPDIAFAQLERWYNIEVAYQGRVPSIGFFGMIDRGKPLSAVLKTLEESKLRFHVEKSGEKIRLIILEE